MTINIRRRFNLSTTQTADVVAKWPKFLPALLITSLPFFLMGIRVFIFSYGDFSIFFTILSTANISTLLSFFSLLPCVVLCTPVLLFLYGKTTSRNLGWIFFFLLIFALLSIFLMIPWYYLGISLVLTAIITLWLSSAAKKQNSTLSWAAAIKKTVWSESSDLHKKPLIGFSIASFILIGTILSFLFNPMWLPEEDIAFKNANNQIERRGGFVLETSEYTTFISIDRTIYKVPTEKVIKRQVCSAHGIPKNTILRVKSYKLKSEPNPICLPYSLPM
jgi:hypothetical protein